MAAAIVNPDSPLKAADLRAINNALYKLSQAVGAADMAERAGIDVAQFRLMIQDVYDQLIAVKQTYFPGAQ